MPPFIAQIGRPFIPGWADLGPFTAECWLIVTLVAILLAPFFRKKSNLLCAGVALVGLFAALASLVWVGVISPAPGARLPLGGLLIGDPFALLWKAMLLLFAMAIVLMWFSTTASTMHQGDGPEFFTLIIGATLGMCLMASTTNLLMIFMAVEMASLPSYVLAGFRKTHRPGAEAAMKYVLFGAACSAIMVFGLSYLYGLFGTLDLAEISRKVAAGQGSVGMLTVALIGVVVGIGAKVSAVPLHFWCPDVFEGASIEVSAFLSVASKGAALALLLRVMMTVAQAMDFQGGQPIKSLAIGIGVLGAMTATVGNTAAFVQNNIKRLLAYSSIAHAGYMLCAVSLLFNLNSRQVDSATGANQPAQALLFYLAVYLFMNLGAFTVAGLVGRNTGSEDLSAFAGLSKRSPLLAHCMLLFMLSLIGLPPVAGFMAKINVWVVLINNGGGWWWLVVVIAINTVMSLYYYARVIKAMYLEEPDRPAFVGHPIGTALAVGSAAALVLMFIFTGPLNRLTSDYSRLRGIEGKPDSNSITAVGER